MLTNYSQEIAKTVEHITLRWKEVDKNILRQIFPLLSEGRSISLEHFAKVTGKDMAEVDSILRLGRVGRDQKGRIVELFGVMFMPTLHRISIDQNVLFSCCALVSHMVPMLIGKNVKVESVDPISHNVVELMISPGGVQSFKPNGAVGTFIKTNETEILNNVGAAFCSHIKHFPDIETATEFVEEDSRRYILGIEDFHRIAQQMYASIWAMEEKVRK